MPKLNIGGQMPDFVFDTPFEKGLSFHEVAKGKKTVLIFLRYYGCIMCQLNMAQYAADYGQVEDAGAQLLIVLQSDPQGIADQLKDPHSLPYRIVCDPQKKIYEMLAINPAHSREEMASPSALAKIEKAKAAGFEHGAYEGDPLQLPAAFVMDENNVVCYAYYGKTMDDLPDTRALVQYL